MPVVNSRLVSGGRDMDCPFHLFGQSRIFVIFPRFYFHLFYSPFYCCRPCLYLGLQHLHTGHTQGMLLRDLFLRCFQVNQLQCSKRAGLYAGRKQPLVYPHIAAVTFDHLSIFSEGRNSVWTGHGTAVTANTVCGIINRKIRLRVFPETGTRTAGDAGRIFTVHTS